MLGLWEVGTGPQRLSSHLAFRVELPNLLDAPARLRAAQIVPLDFAGEPTEEPVVLAWMPAASLYFRDPDGREEARSPDAPDIELALTPNGAATQGGGRRVGGSQWESNPPATLSTAQRV